jgi:hypothetical protein
MKTNPRARKDRLIIQTLPDETLVYDLDRDVAHCLNRSASLVWARCDGQTTPRQIARTVGRELSQPIDERFVWLALDQLARNKLLAEIPTQPNGNGGINRRTALRALGLSAAVALPVVASIVAPTPAQAASGCATGGQSCAVLPCCPGFICNSFNSTCQGT